MITDWVIITPDSLIFIIICKLASTSKIKRQIKASLINVMFKNEKNGELGV